MVDTGRPAAVALAIVVWGLAGALFGGLFAGLHEVLVILGIEGWLLPVIAATIASMTTATFYGAMPVALVGAMAGVLASIGYLLFDGRSIDLAAITVVATIAGFVIGGFYAWTIRGNPRPLTGTFTGVLAGLGSGGLLALGLTVYDGSPGMFVLAAGVVALVGTLYQITEQPIGRTIAGVVPVAISAPLVAGLIASVVGASIWLMTGTTSGALDAVARSALDRIFAEIPDGALGGSLGGAVTGFILELLGFRLEDRLQGEGED